MKPQRIGACLIRDHGGDRLSDPVARMPATNLGAVVAGELACAQSREVRQRAGLDVTAKGAIRFDAYARCGVHGDRIRCGIDGIRRGADVGATSLQAIGTS
jgi:hypothetical protein